MKPTIAPLAPGAMTPPAQLDSSARRRWLSMGLQFAAGSLVACGGGTATPPAPAPSPAPLPTSGPSGRLVFRNSGLVGIWDFATGQERVIDPDDRTTLDPGVSVTPQRQVCVSLERGLHGFAFGLYGLDGTLQRVMEVQRPLSTLNGAMVFNAAGTRVAFSVDEELSASNSTRVHKTLVFSWPAGDLLATHLGCSQPEWAGAQLLALQEGTYRVRLFDDGVVDRGWLANLSVSGLLGGYTASQDGRYVLWQDQSQVYGHDRQTGMQWLVAWERTSNLGAPCLSPDGRHLAVFALDLIIHVPHVLPFVPGATVEVDNTMALDTRLADSGRRMAWIT